MKRSLIIFLFICFSCTCQVHSQDNVSIALFSAEKSDIARIQALSQSTHRERALSKDPWLSPDKLDHLLFSATLASGGYLALKVTGHDENDALLLSAGSVAALGLMKEVFDIYRPSGQASWKDLTMDLVGVALGVVVANSL
jgi:uncharacterized protein YfiM (DUF2279 family)